MHANTVYRGSAMKRVLVSNVPTDRGPIADGILIGFAMASAGETPGALFGWSVVSRTPDPDGRPLEDVLVNLSTD